jgi:uncharacterized membrane protein (Fun14 family)
MTDSAYPSAIGLSPSESPSAPAAGLDTTAGSLIHYLFSWLIGVVRRHTVAIVALYIIAVALTFLPLLVSSLISTAASAAPTWSPRLPFARDANVWYALIVSFPCLAILIATDQEILIDSLKRVRKDGVITISDEDLAHLAARWKGTFKTLNFVGQTLGAIAGALVAYFNFYAYAREGVGLWIADEHGRLLIGGFIYLYCMFLLYSLVAIFVVRNIFIAWLLRDIVAHSQLHMIMRSRFLALTS